MCLALLLLYYICICHKCPALRLLTLLAISLTAVSCISSRLGGEANFGSLWRKVWIAPPTKEEIVGICSQAAGPSVQQRAIRALLETCR